MSDQEKTRKRVQRTPSDVRELALVTGAARDYTTVGQVHAVQKSIADWVVYAAEEKYPDLLDGTRAIEEVLKLVADNAEATWPGFGRLAHELNLAERQQWRSFKTGGLILG